MTNLNTIYTDEEYMAQGFTAEECPKIRRHDELFNQYMLNKQGYNVEPLTEAEWQEFYAIQEELGL
jgi:hypothetical protein